MKIEKVEAFAMRMPTQDTSKHDKGTDTRREEYGDYHIAKDAWSSIYSKRHETALVRIETDDGLVMGLRHKELSVEGVQFHPEFLSRPMRPHPLFCNFLAAAKATYREGTQPPLLSEERER